MSNQPRHGDSIIEKTNNPLGGEKLIASKQFQRFLDELGALFGDSTDISDFVSLLAGADAEIQKLRSENKNLDTFISEISQLLAQNDTVTNLLRAENKVLKLNIEQNDQLIAGLANTIQTLRSESVTMKKRLDNVEQLSVN